MTSPCNIVFQIEDGPQRRGIHGTVVFTRGGATRDDAVEALKRNGFDSAAVQDGYKRSMFEINAHAGGQIFEVFISDERIVAKAEAVA